MKLLFVGTNEERGGAEIHFLELARAMAGAGHTVTVLVDERGLLARRLHAAGVTVLHGRFRNVLDSAGYRSLWRAIQRSDPDWIIGDFGKEYWPLLLTGRLAGRKVALFRHRALPMRRLSQFCVPRLADRFITVSGFSREDLMQRGVPAARVQCLYNPLDTRTWHPDPEAGRRIRSALGLDDTAIVVGYAGRLTREKGVFCLQQALQDAMNEQPDLHALWLGDGTATDALRRSIERSPHARRHHLCGWREDTWRYYNAMDMLAVPTPDREPFGRVSIEAQACGVPVLGARAGGIPESLAPGRTGLLVEPDDPQAWRDAIVHLCDPEPRRALAAAARAHVSRRFEQAMIARDFDALLQGPGDDALVQVPPVAGT